MPGRRYFWGKDSFEIGDLLEHPHEALGFRVARILLIIARLAVVILIEKAARPGPDRLHDALKMLLHLLRGRLPKTRHVLYLRSRRLRALPGTTYYIEPFHCEINRCLIRAHVMPVADDDALWNQIHRRVRVVAARLPFSQTRQRSIEQAVAPQPELPF